MFNPNSIKTFVEIETEEAIKEFRYARATMLQSAVITTQSGKQFNADDLSQTRMSNALTAIALKGMRDTDTLEWSLADTPSGFPTVITVAELKEAMVLAVENMRDIWMRQQNLMP